MHLLAEKQKFLYGLLMRDQMTPSQSGTRFEGACEEGGMKFFFRSTSLVTH